MRTPRSDGDDTETYASLASAFGIGSGLPVVPLFPARSHDSRTGRYSVRSFNGGSRMSGRNEITSTGAWMQYSCSVRPLPVVQPLQGRGSGRAHRDETRVRERRIPEPDMGREYACQ